MVIVVRYVFHEWNKYYPLVILNECLYKLQHENIIGLMLRNHLSSSVLFVIQTNSRFQLI